MAKIRRDIKRQPLFLRIAIAIAIATAFTGKSNASSPTTKLTALATVTTAFDALADAAATATNGDAVKIESLGMQPYTTGNAPPVGTPAQVNNLSATTGDFEGTVDLAWDKVAGARSYEVQVSTTPADSGSYHHAATALKSTATVASLTSGTKYWFRVAAIGSAGQGPWSDPATKMAG